MIENYIHFVFVFEINHVGFIMSYYGSIRDDKVHLSLS